MIIDIMNTLELLDGELFKISDSLHTITICGGASMMFFHKRGSTNDVDVVSGKIDNKLKIASLEVAKILGLKSDWLNSSSSSFNYCYSDGWENRSTSVFFGKALIVNSISKEDLLQSKFFAYIDRGFDLDDLILLNPTRKEIIKLMKTTLANKSNISQGREGIILETRLLLSRLDFEDLKENEI